MTCLSSKDYTQIRNAFIILMHIQNHFPVVSKTEQVIHKRVEKVRDEEKVKRQDLYVLASSYLGILKQKQGQLILENDFHQVAAAANDQNKSVNGDAKTGEFYSNLVSNSRIYYYKNLLDKKQGKEERVEKKPIKFNRESSKATVEREIKITPVREMSKDKREPTPREKSTIKEEKREIKERDEKRVDKERDKRREKRPTSPVEFEGDLSSVSNSSNGSIIQPSNANDVVIVDEHRGEFMSI